jgi:uncharacterized protein (DUF1684 family)
MEESHGRDSALLQWGLYLTAKSNNRNKSRIKEKQWTNLNASGLLIKNTISSAKSTDEMPDYRSDQGCGRRFNEFAINS